MPTGMLIHVAKASGCASVHDLLRQKKSEAVAAAHVDGSLKVTFFSFRRSRVWEIPSSFPFTICKPSATKSRSSTNVNEKTLGCFYTANVPPEN